MYTYNRTYIATVGDNKIVTAAAALLHKIVVGKDVASSVIEVSDSVDDGDGNLVAQFDGSTLMTSLAGGIELDLVCQKGITLDLANQTQVTVLWRPM